MATILSDSELILLSPSASSSLQDVNDTKTLTTGRAGGYGTTIEARIFDAHPVGKYMRYHGTTNTHGKEYNCTITIPDNIAERTKCTLTPYAN